MMPFRLPLLRALPPLAASVALSAADFPLNGHQFTLPHGFSIELAAGPNLVARPVSASFDPEGRLYVTESSGSNLPPSEQLKDPRSRLLRLEDTNGDGRFDRTSVFADRIMFPQGCLWHNGSVYVAGPPSIWRFTDTNGDGVADRREEWYQGQVLTGCANDVHGPYLGPEGMLYWTKGAFARLDLQDHRGRPIRDRAAHIFRAHPDGSGLEVVLSGGMDNPVQVAFTSEGEPILISTFIDLSQPGRRDGLAHAVYGGVFGKANDAVEEPVVLRTGDLLPAMTHFGPAAACALTRYEGDAFGPAYRDNLFATLFNLRKVTRHVLQPHGSTYTTEDSDFLTSNHPDFRPTDVLQDADGSLLVVDTGGWYKLCCPSSQLAKSDVLGAIYRIRAHRPDASPELPFPTPSDRAAAFARLVQPPSFAPNSEIAALKRLALRAQPDDAPRFRQTLAREIPRATASSDAARLARVAAEGLGRMGDRNAVPILIEAITRLGTADRFLEHSLLYALIEIADAPALRPFLNAANPLAQRAALLSLEQIPASGLLPSDVLPALVAASDPLRITARWVARRHPEWSPQLAAFVDRELDRTDLDPAERERRTSLLPLVVSSPEGQRLIAGLLADDRVLPATRGAALHAVANARLKEPPASWIEAIASALHHSDSPDTVRQAAVHAARSLTLPREGAPRLTEALRSLVRHPALPVSLRLDALAALPPAATLGETEFAVLNNSLAPDRPATERLAAATALARLGTSAEQRNLLIPAVAQVGPLELPRLLAAFAPGGDLLLGRSLLTALSNSKALRSLRPEDLQPHLARFPDAIRLEAETLLTTHRFDASEDSLRLDTLLAEIQSLAGDIRRGQAIFNSPQAACAACHRLGYLGGDLGPDLTSIGTVRTDRDLLEAVLFPSASFVRSYEPWLAVDARGEMHSGVLRRETADEIVLGIGPGADVRIPRSELAELTPSPVSTMPSGLDEQLTRQELADLLAFLKNTRWGVN
ncbi:MAG: c-type cytochrome [Verrucomicrobiae bacterium]|nr:c-type cytochrome [Verrucomicrobiae bacterium]